MIPEIITAVGVILLGIFGYVVGYFTDRDKLRANKYDQLIAKMEDQIKQAYKRIEELEEKLDADRVRYQRQIDDLTRENRDLHVEVATMRAKCRQCLDGL